MNQSIMSENISQIALAMSKFKMKVGIIPKDQKVTIRNEKNGTSYDYFYADLAGIDEKITPAEFENELAHTQLFEEVASGTILHTVILHSSGQWLRSTIKVAEHEKIQSLGGEITYLRRYALAAAYGLVTDKDDDGSLANETSRKKKEESKVDHQTGEIKSSNTNYITEKQQKKIYAMTMDCIDYRQKLIKLYGSLSTIPFSDMQTVLEHLEEWKSNPKNNAKPEPKKPEQKGAYYEECPF